MNTPGFEKLNTALQLGEAPDHLKLMQIIGVDIGGTLSWLASQQEAP